MPQRHVFQRRRHIAAHHAGKTREIFGQHGIALVRHRGRTFLAFREIFLGFEDFRALQMADFSRQPFERTGDDTQRREIGSMTVARESLCVETGSVSRPSLRRDMLFDARVDIGECADGAGDRTDRDLLPRGDEPGAGTHKFGIIARELHTESRGLGMDAVAAADGDGVLEFEGAALERG